MLDNAHRILIHPLSCSKRVDERVLKSGFGWVAGIDSATTSLTQLVNSIIRNVDAPYVLLHRPEVVIDPGLYAAAQELIEELNADYPNWGLCAASGVRWDGARTYSHVRRPPESPEPGVCPKPVITVGSEALLLNISQLRAAGCLISEETNEWFEVGLLLALECLRAGNCVLVDRRLMVVDEGEDPELERAVATKRYCAKHFTSHRLPTPYGYIDIPGVAFDEYLALPPVAHHKKDLIGCFDTALHRARENRPMRLAIACRSQFNRPHLLERALLSFAAAQEEAPSSISLKVSILSDQSSERLVSEIEKVSRKFSILSISGVHVNSRSRETSRIDHLMTAIETLSADYIWFIDDDDFVMPGAIPALARTLVPHSPVLVVGTSEVLDEQWKGAQLSRFQTLASFPSSKVFDVFKGENHVPICGMVIPTPLAQERCRDVGATGEYLEDYFLLMRLVTSPRVEVEILPATISGVSLRGTENTVRESVRDKWNYSYAQFVGELIRTNGASNPILWQMTPKG